MASRLSEVAMEFIKADEANRKSMLRAEKAEATLRRFKRLMRPAQPKRIKVDALNGKEIWSLPLD